MTIDTGGGVWELTPNVHRYKGWERTYFPRHSFNFPIAYVLSNKMWFSWYKYFCVTYVVKKTTLRSDGRGEATPPQDFSLDQSLESVVLMKAILSCSPGLKLWELILLWENSLVHQICDRWELKTTGHQRIWANGMTNRHYADPTRNEPTPSSIECYRNDPKGPTPQEEHG